MTITEFVKAHHIRLTAERTDSNPAMDESRDMDHWRVTLKAGRKRMTLAFSKGYGHHGEEPTATEVLDCLASDASGVEGRDFEDWAGDYGYDTDSRKAERTYELCVRQMRKLGQLLGSDAYSELLWNTERE